MRVTIDVTQDDISKGFAGSCPNCPVALAAKRSLPSLPDLIITNWTVFYNDTGMPSSEARLPEDVQEFIRAFDARGASAVQPFAFVLDVPDEVLEATA